MYRKNYKIKYELSIKTSTHILKDIKLRKLTHQKFNIQKLHDTWLIISKIISTMKPTSWEPKARKKIKKKKAGR